MKILLCIAQFQPIVGGAERQAHALARGLICRGHEVVVVTQWYRGRARRETIDGIPVVRDIRASGPGPLYGLTYVSCVARALRRYRRWADVIHVTNIYLEAFVAVALRRWHKRPVVVRPACAGYFGDLARLQRFRAWPLYPGPGRVSVRKLVETIACADAFLANSGELRDELYAAGFPLDRIIRIPNGVDVEHFRPGGGGIEDRQSLGLPEGPLLLFVGRLDPQKGLHTLLDALHPLLRVWPTLHLVLLGAGPLHGEVEARVARTGLADRILLRGLVGDVVPYLRVADIFVLPSLAEGMPNALLEAMATGLPCVASAIGGCRDVITDRQTGLLVPPRDTAALQGALQELLQSPALRERLGAAARRDAVARFGLEEMVGRYEACYRAVIAGDPVAAAVGAGPGGHCPA
jgi:glycosyltransferase involved in cell wall biosynthesis